MGLFGPNLRKEYAREIREIERGGRRAETHQPPMKIDSHEPRLDERHLRLFDDFRLFGRVVNLHHEWGGWSVSETAKTDVQDDDGPNYGRHYRVYFNALDIGELTVAPDFLPKAYGAENGVRLELAIEFAQFIPYGDIHQLLDFLFMACGPILDGDEMRRRARDQATAVLAAHLWEAQRRPDLMLPLDVRIEGPYAFFTELASAFESCSE